MPTRRQEIREALEAREWGFDELRAEFGLRVRELADDLRHIEQTLRAAGLRLAVRPPRCRACGFEFQGRERRRLHTPGRCPECHGVRIAAAVLGVEPR